MQSIAMIAFLALLALPAQTAAVGGPAYFSAGSVLTSRRPAMEHSLPAVSASGMHARMLLTPESAQLQLWVLGLPTDQQDDVYASLKAAGGEVLHALPDVDHHWLIHAPHTHAVQSIMDKHADVTAAPFPDAYKLSPVILLLAEAYDAIKAGSAPAPAAGNLPEDLQFVHHEMTGGRVQVVLTAKTMGVPLTQMTELSVTAERKLKWMLKAVGSTCQPTIYPSMNSLNVMVCPEGVEIAAAWLASQPQVTWLDMQRTMQPADMYATAKIMATTLLPNASWPAPEVLLGNATANPYTPYWAVGLDGSGQVAGIVDSGVDLDSCYVYNSSQSDYQSGPHTFTAPITNDPYAVLNNVTYYQNLASQKVVAYVFGADSTDNIAGHGTHVATSIVGSRSGSNPMTDPDIATGIAPNAKLAVFDIGLPDPQQGLLFQPWMQSFNRIFGSLKLLGGAYVICNSWGIPGDLSYTTSQCADLDGYMYGSGNDTLAVFAVGNSGQDVTTLNTTGQVSNPSTCKNVLSVGAAENYAYKGQADLTPFDLLQNGTMVQLNSSDFAAPRQSGSLLYQNTSQSLVKPVAALEKFDSRFSVYPGNATLPVVVASPLDACTALNTTAFPTTPFYLLIAPNMSLCNTSASLANAFAIQLAAGVLVGITGGLDNNPVPAFDARATSFIAPATQSFVIDSIQAGTPVTATWLPPNATALPPTENVAEFSSYGSQTAFTPPSAGPRSLYYRIKPEVTAPGYILAAKSDGKFSGQQDQCSVQEEKGTSMACPQVTGAVILARSYFMNGFYPTGAAVANNSFTPSGPLLKAVMIAGTTAMQGVSGADKRPLDPPPSQFQGFGQISLMNSLPLASDTRGWKLQVVNLTTVSVQGSQKTYAVNVSDSDAGKPLIVVLTWWDPPAFEGATASGVNNLDLTVTGPTSTNYYPNGLDGPDLVNNVEKIYIPSAAAGAYTVSINATYLAVNTPNTPYALVVLGAISNTLAV